MNNYYEDVLDRIPEDPKWFDDLGYPRYCEFSPSKVSDVYAEQAALLLVACQGCDQTFLVSVSSNPYERLDKIGGESILDVYERNGSLWYGDPPNIRCCPSGPTMSSLTFAIVQFWIREKNEWVRKTELEGPCGV